MPATAAVKELLPVRPQRREHVLEVGRRSRNRTKRRRIERATPCGEKRDRCNPASDLEAAAGDVPVRHAISGEVQGGSKQQRAQTRTSHRAGHRTSRNM
jgi:hypothetical protein